MTVYKKIKLTPEQLVAATTVVNGLPVETVEVAEAQSFPEAEAVMAAFEADLARRRWTRIDAPLAKAVVDAAREEIRRRETNYVGTDSDAELSYLNIVSRAADNVGGALNPSCLGLPRGDASCGPKTLTARNVYDDISAFWNQQSVNLAGRLWVSADVVLDLMDLARISQTPKGEDLYEACARR